jgi:putative N6-adenine-specific DNA methylase
MAGSDRDAAVVARALRNADRAGVADFVSFTPGELVQLPPSSPPGLVVTNPPYGGRLGGDVDLPQFYRRLGRELPRAFPSWRIALLAPESELARCTGLPLRAIARLENGGIPVGLYVTS